ncbi:MAG: hypothetical protein DSY76_07415 [Bacteroidetes bacterium]|nr:MAG: hypothetical protein DSY76_07415 [Bacteroidota bacterium]
MSTLKLLIVDDEPGIRSGITRILKNHKVNYPFLNEDFFFEIYEAKTGEIGLDIIRKQKPDIVLLDNKLPGISGIELLEIIRKDHLDIYVMMITSYASLDLAVRATKNGAYSFIPKPFTPSELKSAINELTKHLFLKRVTKKMQESGKEVRFQFLSILSHELKSPLNAIDGYLNLMKDRQLGNNLDNYSEMIERSIIRIKGMRSLIMDLLDLTKLESGKKTQKIESVDLKEIATMAMNTMEPMAIQQNIKLILKADKQLIIKADADEIEIIFNNLISNAVKYNRENGSVIISLTQNANEAKISVKDTGIGMEQEDVDKLFHEFTRIRNEKTKHISGSGLGLSILKKMVDKYNGKIEVNSVWGEGTEFIVSLHSL